ncbi:sensor histidine kinase [Microbacterium sp. PMB16]|uniref:sensor histidine kinase n=1 Tax=Microbacterium sp. PMB16 TaxID=3120157 RepID=UPI003F4BCD65
MSSLRFSGLATSLTDVMAVAIVVLLGFLPYPEAVFQARGLLLVPALLPAAVMPFRRRRPIEVLGVCLACSMIAALFGLLSPGAMVAVAIAAFAVTDRLPRRVGLPVVGATALIVLLTNAVTLDGEVFDSRALQFLLFIVLAGALGDATRTRREYADAMRERAERAERTREEEARRRVAEERLRIARDLHDIVAHQIAVISLNAGVASTAISDRPERAQEALTTIRAASRTVLTDIGGLMSVLRDGDPEAQGDRHPPAGLDGLDELVAQVEGAGLRVDLHRDAGLGELGGASQHVAYLAIREGLTNAHKHGEGARATLMIRDGDGAVEITVTNAVGADGVDASPSGHGLRGLRERVAAVRGRVYAAPEGNEFRLRVEIPTAEDRT